MDSTIDRDAAIIVPFPVKELYVPTCLDCEHYYAGVKGSYCGYFAEPILYEDIAEECSEFQPV